MKKIIRNNVFETNSSSTHSFSLAKSTDKKKKEISFEVKSRSSKCIVLLGFIDNAERDYINNWDYINYSEDINEVKQELITKMTNYKKEDLEALSFYELIKRIYMNTNNPYALFENIEDEDIKNTVMNFSVYRDQILKMKDLIIEVYAELENMNKQDALDKLYYEAYKNEKIEDILKNSNNKEKDLKEYLKYLISDKEDALEYASNYLKINIERNKGRFYCDNYFNNGCLIECNCGFGNFNDIYKNLNLDKYQSEKELKNYIKELLSDEYKFEAIEMYCGLYKEGNGEIY